MRIGRQSKTIVRNNQDEEGVKVRAQNSAQVEDVTDATHAVSGAIKLEAKPAFQAVKVSKRERSLAQDSFFTKPEHPHERETGSTLHQNVNPMLAYPPYSPCRAEVRSTMLTMCSLENKQRTL